MLLYNHLDKQQYTTATKAAITSRTYTTVIASITIIFNVPKGND